jgi:hypothetical protein
LLKDRVHSPAKITAAERHLRFYKARVHAQRKYSEVLQAPGGLVYENQLMSVYIDFGWQSATADRKCDNCGKDIHSEMWMCPKEAR